MTELDSDLRDLYQDLILDHGKHPRNYRKMETPVCEAVGHNPLCGDKLVLYIDVNAQGQIKDVSFQGDGCAISMASASMMSEILKGKTAEQARLLLQYFGALCTDETDLAASLAVHLDPDDLERLEALSGVRHYPVRVKCATLAWRTLEVALTPNAEKEAQTE